MRPIRVVGYTWGIQSVCLLKDASSPHGGRLEERPVIPAGMPLLLAPSIMVANQTDTCMGRTRTRGITYVSIGFFAKRTVRRTRTEVFVCQVFLLLSALCYRNTWKTSRV